MFLIEGPPGAYDQAAKIGCKIDMWLKRHQRNRRATVSQSELLFPSEKGGEPA